MGEQLRSFYIMSIALMEIKATTHSYHLSIFNEGKGKILRALREKKAVYAGANEEILFRLVIQ